MVFESRPPTLDAFAFAAGGADKRPALPADLLRAVRGRLQIVSLLIVAATALTTLVNLLTRVLTLETLHYASLVAGWVLSFAMFAIARWSRLRPDLLLNLGLVYEVLIALVFSLSSAHVRWLTDDPGSFVGWSPIAVWVLVYPIIVPNTSGKTALASFVTALTEPVAVLILVASDMSVLPPAAAFVRKLWPNLFAAILAIGVARIVYRLGEQLREARQLGSYQLETLLGKGGMGEVWKATHRMLARPAAVKLIRAEALGTDDLESAARALKRFEREAQSTATLRSPHTIELYDFGISQGGTFYYVMELLDGVDLQTLVEQHGHQPPGRVVRILRQACHSLAEAHDAGMVHRDIKPANIFLCRYGADYDFAKVLDFGIVKHRAVRDEREAQLTAVGAFTGTPAYMPPEMVLGAGEIDGRADLYSLGCIGYWLLTGHMVFGGLNPMAVMAAHAHQKPASPSSRTDQEIPPGLDDIIMRCLDKDPSHRPRTARELSWELAALEIEQQWSEEDARAWWADRDAGEREG
jgi:serine/threonine-protein kinase